MKTIRELTLEVAEYLSDEKESDDYMRHCEENDLDPYEYEHNANLEGGHIYAKAKLLKDEYETNQNTIKTPST